MAALQSGDYAEADRTFSRLALSLPDVAEVHSNLGLARYYEKKPDLARQSFVKSLALNTKLFVPNFYLGKIGCEAGSYKEAIPFLRRAVQLQPGEPASRALLAEVLSHI